MRHPHLSRATLLVAVVLTVPILPQCWGAETIQPVNPLASAEARRVYDYLQSIQGRQTLSGHHVMYGRMKDRDLGHIVETTGKYPALIEFEGGIFARKFHEDYDSLQDQLVEDAIAYWREGGLIAICWHWGNPMEPRNTYQNTKLKFDIEAALTAGTPENDALIKDLDVTARMLKALRDAQVPVLWRPLHEMCGGWFWWSMQGKEPAQKLWRFIFEYYTNHHELNNLLWVYSASHDMRIDWAPGLEVADIIGVDIYRKGQQDERDNYDRMSSIAGGKPVALTECDILPDPTITLERGFMWGWTCTWHSRYLRSNTPDFLKTYYQSKLVLTRDELPDLREGVSGGGGPGVFEDHGDVGAAGNAGSVEFNQGQGAYTVAGGGENMWFDQDAFHFVWKQVSGDVTLAADIEFVGQGGHEHRKACLLVRQSLEPNAAYADAALHGDGLTSLQYRPTSGDRTYEIQANVSGPRRLRIEKRGKYISMSYAMDGGSLKPAGGSFRLDLQDPFYVGLGVCAHDNNALEEAQFTKVELTAGASTDEDGRLLSTLETVPIDSKDRRVVYTTTNHIEAPNWLPDGEDLLFNSGGRIYRIPVTGGEPTLIDTGFATRCNNDHGLSPDGTQLVISDQSQGQRRSLIYTLPVGGGTPRLVTELGPSYWHGWSPDGQTLAYCAERNGEYDVYTLPVAGGAETRLTTAPGLDDGPDYSPDGRWIYFNSVRSGSMQIWRTQTDGSAQEQVTDDAYNNWFPHPSPDGTWLVFLSYEPGVEGHPANQDVTLRLMPVGGGEIQVLAKLFGGQGTINVPSWSPDSRRVAFVSYQFTP